MKEEIMPSNPEKKTPTDIHKIALDSMRDGCQIIDFEYRYLYLNPVAIAHSQKTEKELLGKTMMEIYPGIEKTEMFGKLKICMETKRPQVMENKFQFPNDSEAWFQLRFEPNILGVLIHSMDITESKRIEHSLIKANESITERWRFALEGSGDGIWDWNIVTDLVFYSDQWKRLLGYEPNEIGNSLDEWSKRVHPDDMEICQKDLDAHFAGETEIYSNEHRILCKNGNYKWVFDRGKIINRSEDGKPLRVVGTYTDITERKFIEEKLRNLSEFQNIILNGTEYAIIATDVDGIIRNFNKGGELMLGYQSEELIGITSPAIFHEIEEVIERAKTLSTELQVLVEPGFEVFVAKAKLGKADTNEWTYIKKDKSRITVELSVTTLRDKNGEVTGFLGIANDITESKKARQELIQTKEQVEATNQALVSFKLALDEHALVSITDTNGKITYVNEKFCEVSQYLPPELIGKDHRLINSGYHDKNFFRNLWETIKNKGVWKGEIRNRAKDGSYYWVNSTIIGFLDLEGNLNQFIAIRTNITESKKQEEELIKAKEQAEAANLAKSEFLANMTHELRTPLNGVIGFTDLLIKTKLDEEQKRFMTTVYKSANSLLDLINDILDFSKIEAGKLELNISEVNLSTLIAQVIDIARYKAQEKQLDIILNLEDNSPRFFWVDPIRLRQVLLNLLGNAIKFTEKGKVEISVRALEINKEDKKTKFLFSVKDTGIGISVENQKNIFNAFTQADSSTNRKYGGTGLGLSISNKLLSLMNTKLELETELGKGSNFYFELWANTGIETENKIKEQEELRITSISHKLGKQLFKILIADDNPVNLFLMKSLVIQILPDSITIEANTGQRAFELYKTEKPDIIFMDIQMPEMNGYEATKAIRKMETEKNIPIIALTAGTVKGERERCEQAGMNDYLTKPVIKSSIENAILKWLSGNNTPLIKIENEPAPLAYIHYNEKVLLERLDGDEEFLHSLLVRAKDDLNSDFLKLCESYKEKDIAKVIATAHKIKGTALTLCFENLVNLISILESLESFEEENIRKQISQVQEEIELLKTMISF